MASDVTFTQVNALFGGDATATTSVPYYEKGDIVYWKGDWSGSNPLWFKGKSYLVDEIIPPRKDYGSGAYDYQDKNGVVPTNASSPGVAPDDETVGHHYRLIPTGSNTGNGLGLVHEVDVMGATEAQAYLPSQTDQLLTDS